MPVRTMRYEVAANILLVVHGPRTIDANEWSSYCLARGALSYEGELVVVDRSCPGPTSLQRAELSRSLGKRTPIPNVAVISASAAHRGIATVLNWMQKGTLKLYTPARLDDALKYAGVAPSAKGTILRRVRELAIAVDSPWIAEVIALAPTTEEGA